MVIGKHEQFTEWKPHHYVLVLRSLVSLVGESQPIWMKMPNALINQRNINHLRYRQTTKHWVKTRPLRFSSKITCSACGRESAIIVINSLVKRENMWSVQYRYLVKKDFLFEVIPPFHFFSSIIRQTTMNWVLCISTSSKWYLFVRKTLC